MRIRVALLDRDINYLERISVLFMNRLADKLEIYSFSEPDSAVNSLKTAKIDVFLANEEFDIDTTALPSRCSFAYLTDRSGIESIKNIKAVAKFQRIDMFYKQILDVYSDNAALVSGIKKGDSKALKLISFAAAGSGAGASTAAAAFARYAAYKGLKVLYLNLERFGSSEVFFNSEGNGDFGDVLYALKSKKTNLALKLESTVQTDASRVMFYKSPKLALDLQELSREELDSLIEQFEASGNYDLVVIDCDFVLDDMFFKIVDRSIYTVLVSETGIISRTKLNRAVSAFKELTEQKESKAADKLVLLYNKLLGAEADMEGNEEIRVVGRIPLIRNAAPVQMADQIASMNIFAELLQEVNS